MSTVMESGSYMERTAYLAGGRVTVGKIQQVQDGKVVTTYAGKLRGIICGVGNQWQFPTPEAAREHATKFRDGCKAKVEAMESEQ